MLQQEVKLCPLLWVVLQRLCGQGCRCEFLCKEGMKNYSDDPSASSLHPSNLCLPPTQAPYPCGIIILRSDSVAFWVPGSIPLLKAKASSTGGLTAIAKVEKILEELLNSSLKMDSCHFYIILYPLPQRWLKKEDLVCVPGGRSIYFWIVS